MGQHAYSATIDVSNQASWQALSGFIDQAIQADGWTLTTDTGQTDPSTAALPVANNSGVFRLYKSPGTLTPVYVKISYERDAANHPQLGIQVGTGTNGAGALTGVTTTHKTLDTNIGAAAAQCYVSGDTGWLTILLIRTDLGAALNYLLDRSVDANENYTSDYITQIGYSDAVAVTQESKMLAGGTQPFSNNRIVCPAPDNAGSWIIDTFLSIPLMLPVVRGGLAQHSPNCCVHSGSAADFTANTQTVVNVYGTNHTYIVSPTSANQSGSATKAMFRYQ